MNDPKQPTAKVVLNAITYKEIPDKKIGVPMPVSIDISDLLEQHDVHPVCIHGVSICPGQEGEYGESVTYTSFVVREEDIRQMVDEIYNVIDAAIVNTNQSKASKRLIDNILCAFLSKCWDKIRG